MEKQIMQIMPRRDQFQPGRGVNTAATFINNTKNNQAYNKQQIQYRGQVINIPVGISSVTLQMPGNARTLLFIALASANILTVGCIVDFFVNNEKILDTVDASFINTTALTNAATCFNPNMTPGGYIQLNRAVSGTDKLLLNFNNTTAALINTNFIAAYTDYSPRT